MPFNVSGEKGRFTYPQQLLEKAGTTYYPNVDFKVNCEPYFVTGEPHWAFDNYRCHGAPTGASYLFYTQPGWGSYFETVYPRTKIKCVTYAIDPEIHYPVDTEQEYDIGFIGNFTDSINERPQYLDALKKEFNCYFSEDTQTEHISLALSKCKVLFNHIRSEEVNIRFFEALAIGPQLCSHTPALHYLVPDDCYLTFTSIEDCISKAKKLLKSKLMREEISGRGRSAVAKHTYKQRVEEMLYFTGKI